MFEVGECVLDGAEQILRSVRREVVCKQTEPSRSANTNAFRIAMRPLTHW